MFGGLDIKGSSGSTSGKSGGDGEKKEEKSASSSGFSFLNAETPAPAPAEAPAASGFGFLNGGSSEAEKSAPEPAPAAQSGFSFLSSPAPANPADSNVANSAVAQSSAADPAPAPALASTAVSSGFDFLGSASAPSTKPVEIATRDSPSPAPSELSMASSDFLATPNPPQAAGAGVSFGTAMTASKPKKKRNRATKVGIHKDGIPPRVPASIPEPASVSIPDPSPSVTIAEPAASSTRDQALQASQRAEEFLHEKLQTDDGIPAIQTTKSEDDMIAAAKAAAEEAQSLNHGQKRGFGNRLGGLFRKSTSGSANAPGVTMSTSNGSSHDMDKAAEPTKTTVTDRLQLEQEASKKAAAERNLQMMNESVASAAAPSMTLDVSSKEPRDPMTSPFQPPRPLSEMKSIDAPKPVLTMGNNQPLTMMPTHVAAAPPKPKLRTPTDDFQDMMRDFHKQVIQTMENVMRLRTQRSGLLQERFVTVAKERYATQQKARAEIQLQEAAEQEDFEIAAAMDAEIESHERERAEYESILTNISGALKQLDEQKGKLVEDVSGCFEAIQTKLQAFQKEQESKDTEASKEALARFSETSKQLSTENDRLQQDLKHLERDAKLVADEREELEATISEQAGEYEQLRDTAREKLATVEEEIEELRAALAVKMKEASSLRTEAAGHDEAVLRVRVKFARQLTRVQKKEGTVRDNQEEWSLEKVSYEKSKEEHDKEVAEHSEALLSHEKLLDALSREIEMAGTFEVIVAEEIGFDITAQGDSEMDDELAQMQAEVVKCEAAVSEAKAAAKLAGKALSDLETEKKSIEESLPLLEEAKKAAAAKRDFKAAGQASKDAKAATARMAVVEKELADGALERKEEAEKQLAVLEESLEAKRQVAHVREKESGVKSMERLADNIKRLSATKEKVCSNADKHSIQAVGAYVLDGQIAALKTEGETYGEKYGGWDSLLGDLGNSPVDIPKSDPLETPNIEEPIKEETPVDVPASLPSEPVASKAEQYAAFRDLSAELKQVEVDLEVAVENEDFEKAAELQETLERLMADVGKLHLSDDEMERVLSGELPQADNVEAPAESETGIEEAGAADNGTPVEAGATENETLVEEAGTPIQSPESADKEQSVVGSTSTDHKQEATDLTNEENAIQPGTSGEATDVADEQVPEDS